MSTSSTTPWHTNLFIGFAVGTTDAYINHPLWVLKTRQQLRQPFTLNPLVLYRGVFTHAMSSVPMDMLQVSISRIAMERFFADDMSYTKKRLISGCIGGTAAAFISTPVELCMTRQQQQLDPIATLKKTPFKGWVATAARDSLFCLGFFSAVPLLTTFFEKQGSPPPLATISAGLAAGVMTAVVSHPIDTIKTAVQGSLKHLSYAKACVDILKTDGPLGFVTGLPLRTARVASGILVLGSMNDFLEKNLIDNG